jgi:CelD/BcsL family acetyltransferase involved in cellulose biosynthesis
MRRVIHVEPADPRWDAFVLAAPDGTVFHHSGWLAALEHENGQHPLMLACEEPDGCFSAILPVMETRGVPLGLGGAGTARRLSSLPRTPVAGPLGQSQAGVVAVVRAAMDVARASKLPLQLKSAAPVLDGLVPGLKGEPWRLSYVKPLSTDPDDLRFGSSRNHARIGWAVRKAEREGLRVRDALDESELKAWHRLYLDVNRRRGLPSRPYRMFRAAWERLRPGGFLRLLVVHQRRGGTDRLVAGSMLLMLGRTTFYAFNGVLRDALPSRPNDLLQWHAMRQAAAAGYSWYDFGEVAEGNEGLAGFKAKWGTEARRLVRYHAPPLHGHEARYAIETDNWLHEIARGAWRHVPLSVTAYCGDRVYRFL